MPEVEIRKHVTATFLSRGSFMPEVSKELEVTTEDPTIVAKCAPEGAFCFFLQYWITSTTTVGGEYFEKTEPGGERSGRFYLGGTIYTLAQLRAAFGDDPNMRILIANVEDNDWSKVIQCRAGNWQSFREGDVLLDIVA